MKIGVLGAGLISSEHVAGISALLKKNLVKGVLSGIYDPDASRAEEFKARFGFERVFSSAEELIGSDSADAVFILTWTGEHARLTEAAARAGKPLFCEKPLGRSLAEARAMHETVRKSGVPNQIGLILRTSPAYGFVKSLCSNPELGRLMAVNFRDDQYFPNQGRYNSVWRQDVEKAGGGTFIEHSIHDVDIMRWMFGEFESVACATGNFAGHRGIEDLAVANGRLAKGGTVCFLSLWHNILSRPSTRHLEIFFENGRIVAPNELFGPVSLELKDRPLNAFEQSDVARWFLAENPDAAPIGLEFESYTMIEDFRFLKAVQEGRAPSPDFEEGLAAHEFVEAAYLSAGKGGVEVKLPL